ncbi:MAG: MBL fold metallo-hydrolase, partial [Candidatus Dadabacteria bacterium]|nr:MBL fold metallo-hydrolase [Candidatus Dadabacteria bacterium]NIS08794.1 MBL fold metallo-hydrolase [Candidatus Dadabacteria bacterium]NIV42737.1 MBL fold metallo-hydrolase [Candidatus Dadabacteria bacterium]NIY22138.1 MBL fold metallo-hydrolase [Candidatus Dadabacteria bacterium]
PAYNLSAKPYHPKSKSWVGYILDLGGTRIYHAGDTDDIPEMKKLKVDIAFLPI